MCSQLALLKNDFELALLYSEIVPWRSPVMTHPLQ